MPVLAASLMMATSFKPPINFFFSATFKVSMSTEAAAEARSSYLRKCAFMMRATGMKMFANKQAGHGLIDV